MLKQSKAGGGGVLRASRAPWGKKALKVPCPALYLCIPTLLWGPAIATGQLGSSFGFSFAFVSSSFSGILCFPFLQDAANGRQLVACHS